MEVDEESFIEWLRARGTPEAHLEVYRRGVAELGKYNDVEAAVRSEEASGASARRIANLREVGARMAEYRAATRPAPEPELDLLPGPKPVVAASFAPPPRPAPMAALDVAPNARGRSTQSPPARELPPRAGCTCRKRYDVYLDDDFGALAKVFGGGIGIGTFILIRLVGIFGALAIGLTLAGIGGLATIVSACFRCEGCRVPIRDLDADERSRLRVARGKVTLITIALLGGAAVCALIWWSVVSRNG